MLSLSSFYRAVSLVEESNGEFTYKFSKGEYENFIDLIRVLCYQMDKGWHRHNKQPLLIYIDQEQLRIVKA